MNLLGKWGSNGAIGHITRVLVYLFIKETVHILGALLIEAGADYRLARLMFWINKSFLQCLQTTTQPDNSIYCQVSSSLFLTTRAKGRPYLFKDLSLSSSIRACFHRLWRCIPIFRHPCMVLWHFVYNPPAQQSICTTLCKNANNLYSKMVCNIHLKLCVPHLFVGWQC